MYFSRYICNSNFRTFGDKLANKLKSWKWKLDNQWQLYACCSHSKNKSSLSTSVDGNWATLAMLPRPILFPSLSLSPSFSLSLSPVISLLRTKTEADALNSPQRNRTATLIVMNASEGCILWSEHPPTFLSSWPCHRIEINHRGIYVLLVTYLVWLLNYIIWLIFSNEQ